MKTRNLVLVAAILVSLTGCFGGSRFPIEAVTGTVTKGGAPVEGASVQFQPAEGRTSFGKTDAQGRYTLQYPPAANGALIGQHSVLLRIPQRSPADIPDFATLGPDAQEMAQQARPVTVPTPVTVVEGGKNVFDFEVDDLR